MLSDQLPLSCSIAHLETETSISGLHFERKSLGRRFNRSGSRQRSKSKQIVVDPREGQSFYIKNVFVSSSQRGDKDGMAVPSNREGQKSTNGDKNSSKNIQRRNNHMRQSRSALPIQGETKEFYQLKCGELSSLLDQSHSYIVQLQSRLDQLQEEMSRSAVQGSDAQLARERTDPAKTVKEGKGNNLANLRKQIASTKAVEVVPTDILHQQIKLLQSQNLFLKEEVKTLKRTIQEHEKTSNRIHSQKEAELEAIIDRQRKSLLEDEKMQDQLKMEISMLRLRESKKQENKQQAQSEELAYLKYRYQKMRKKYEETKKELEGYKKQERVNYLLSDRSEGEVVFSLSP